MEDKSAIGKEDKGTSYWWRCRNNGGRRVCDLEGEVWEVDERGDNRERSAAWWRPGRKGAMGKAEKGQPKEKKNSEI